MSTPRTADRELGETDETLDRGENEGELSDSVRQLILSFGGAVSEQTWNADAYARKPLQRV